MIIGIAFNLTNILLAIYNNSITALKLNSILYYIVFAVITFVLPAVLLGFFLRGKNTKPLAIIILILCVLNIIVTVSQLLISIPKYLVYNTLGLANTLILYSSGHTLSIIGNIVTALGTIGLLIRKEK